MTHPAYIGLRLHGDAETAPPAGTYVDWPEPECPCCGGTGER